MPIGYTFAETDCKLPGTNHGDNKPLTWKGNKMLDSGASVCEIAKKCDAMEIDIKISDKTELHKTQMYQDATTKQQKELDEYATHGKGHDNPNLKCYEIQYVVSDKD